MTLPTPRVASLRYRIRPGNGVRFDSPAPYDFETPKFHGHLDRERLTLVPKILMHTRDEAIAVATTLVQSCEIDAGLRVRAGLFSAELEHVTMEGDVPINFILSVRNKSEHSIKLVWDEASYIDYDGDLTKVMHEGVKYIDRNSAQSPSVIPAKQRLADVVYPNDRVSYREGYYGRYYSRPGGWQHAPLI
jgi:hypothetical protein